jgi:hypothetical protein
VCEGNEILSNNGNATWKFAVAPCNNEISDHSLAIMDITDLSLILKGHLSLILKGQDVGAAFSQPIGTDFEVGLQSGNHVVLPTSKCTKITPNN